MIHRRDAENAEKIGTGLGLREKIRAPHPQVARIRELCWLEFLGVLRVSAVNREFPRFGAISAKMSPTIGWVAHATAPSGGGGGIS
jgi:hypothetical protein